MAWSADFLKNIRAQTNDFRLRLTLDGLNYDDEVIRVSQIVRSNTLSAGTVMVTVDNSDNTFGTRIQDSTWDLQRSYVRMYFIGLESEVMDLFAGIPYKIEYQGKNATIYMRDRMATMLKREIGNWEQEIDYYSGSAPHAGDSYSAAEMVWHLLTDSNAGNLDSTRSSANVAIDWDQFLAWKTDCTSKGYKLKGRFEGTSIRDILLRVCELTDSMIWVNSSGLFSMSMHDESSQGTGSENYTNDNIVPEKKGGIRFLTIDIDNIKNHLTTWYGIDPTAEHPEKSGTRVYTEDTGSSGHYGEFRHVDMDQTIWHVDTTSSSSYRGAWLQRYKDPHRMVQFETFMMSWLEDVSSKVNVTNSLLWSGAKTMTITEMVLLPDIGKTIMTLYWDWD